MKIILKKGTYFFIIMTILSCNSKKILINNIEVNTYPNTEYKKSKEIFIGTLKKNEYDELVKRLETELKTSLPKDKSILINYNQRAPNCISTRFSEKVNKQIAINRVRISSRMSTNYNAIDFFVYTKDSFDKEIYEQMTEFNIDSGFFYETVFTEHENCAGFLIIKPNGDFYKRYGEDYYSEVKDFFEKE